MLDALVSLLEVALSDRRGTIKCMRLKISQVIFVFTLFFNLDVSADKNIPPLEKDLYLHGTSLYFNEYSKKYYGYDLLIRLHNEYDKKTKEILKRCDKWSKESADYVAKYNPECLLDYEKKVVSDFYLYLTDELKLKRNRFKKVSSCITQYSGDGNEFIDINYSQYDCAKIKGGLGLETYSDIVIQRSNLLTRFRVSSERDRVQIDKLELIEVEEYKKLYQQLDEKHQAYMKKIEGESLL